MTPDELRAVIDGLAHDIALRPDVSLPATRGLEPGGPAVEVLGGAGVAVFDLPPGGLPEDDLWGRSANCTLLITPHAVAVGELIVAPLHKVCLGRMADAMLRYQEVHPEVETLHGVLGAILDEARAAVAEEEAEAARAAVMAPVLEARAREAQAASDERARQQWVRAGLPLPPEPGSFLFVPRAGVPFDRWAVCSDMMDPEPYQFEDDAPRVVGVHRFGDMWVAEGDPDEWPEMPDDMGTGIWVPGDVLPGEWVKG